MVRQNHPFGRATCAIPAWPPGYGRFSMTFAAGCHGNLAQATAAGRRSGSHTPARLRPVARLAGLVASGEGFGTIGLFGPHTSVAMAITLGLPGAARRSGPIVSGTQNTVSATIRIAAEPALLAVNDDQLTALRQLI